MVDQKIAKVRKDLDSVPKERERRQSRLDDLKRRADTTKTAATATEVEIRSNETGIKECDQEIKKLSERLNTVKNNAEYQAILLQVESVKKTIGELEEEGLGLMEKLEGLRGELSTADEAVAEEQKVFDEFNVEADKILTTRGAELAELDGERQQFIGDVSPELLQHYDRMLSARSHFVVCPVEGETCTGCYTSIPPNLQVKLRAGTAVVKCDACQRILYYAE